KGITNRTSRPVTSTNLTQNSFGNDGILAGGSSVNIDGSSSRRKGESGQPYGVDGGSAGISDDQFTRTTLLRVRAIKNPEEITRSMAFEFKDNDKQLYLTISNEGLKKADVIYKDTLVQVDKVITDKNNIVQQVVISGGVPIMFSNLDKGSQKAIEEYILAKEKESKDNLTTISRAIASFEDDSSAERDRYLTLVCQMDPALSQCSK
ncbi:MAG: hypothetical protein OEW87_08825, partial [Flavobacteriaceae bacterium]|nr:hypothetical protein [Flavobacteriaceae bacterium]